MLVGRSGTGKRHHIRHFVRHLNCAVCRPFDHPDPPFYTQTCDCNSCKLLEQDATPDLCQLTGHESIDELRTKVVHFPDHMPLQLSHSFLILENLHRYSKDRLDTLLKILEEPHEHLKILATATTTQSIAGPVLSRLRQLRHPNLTAEQLRTIVEATPALKPLARQLGAYPFRSVDELQLYHHYKFEAKFEAFWLADIISLERAISQFLKQLRKDDAYHTPDVLEFFIEFFIQRVAHFCTTHADARPELQRVRTALPALARRAYETLGQYLHAPDASTHIDRDRQVMAFFTSLAVLRDAYGVRTS
jgi:Cdc6-like AAA superfamily ATPase